MGTTARLRPELVAEIIGAQFPHLRPLRVTYLGEGYDSTAFDVNDNLVFRFPKRLDIERQLRVETDILPVLAERTPVPIPEFSFHGMPSALFPRHFAGYPKLAGVPGIAVAMTDLQLRQLAPVLGGFISFLHSFPASTATRFHVPERAPGILMEELRAEALSDLHVVRKVDPDAPEEKLRTLLETGIDGGERAPIVPTLVHGDLAAEHILLDPLTHEITGIIDWGEISLGDPAIDFAGIFHWGGRDFMDAALSHYRGKPDDGLFDRARFFAACKGVGDIVFGLKTHRREYINSGVRALKLTWKSWPTGS